MERQKSADRKARRHRKSESDSKPPLSPPPAPPPPPAPALSERLEEKPPKFEPSSPAGDSSSGLDDQAEWQHWSGAGVTFDSSPGVSQPPAMAQPSAASRYILHRSETGVFSPGLRHSSSSPSHHFGDLQDMKVDDVVEPEGTEDDRSCNSTGASDFPPSDNGEDAASHPSPLSSQASNPPPRRLYPKQKHVKKTSAEVAEEADRRSWEARLNALIAVLPKLAEPATARKIQFMILDDLNLRTQLTPGEMFDCDMKRVSRDCVNRICDFVESKGYKVGV